MKYLKWWLNRTKSGLSKFIIFLTNQSCHKCKNLLWWYSLSYLVLPGQLCNKCFLYKNVVFLVFVAVPLEIKLCPVKKIVIIAISNFIVKNPFFLLDENEPHKYIMDEVDLQLRFQTSLIIAKVNWAILRVNGKLANYLEVNIK